jgi:hypothetical protein
MFPVMHLHYMSVAMNNIASGFTASSKQPAYPRKLTAITNARVFDGERVIEERTVVIDGSHIRAVGVLAPTGDSIIDAHGATLMPGLIDAHEHANVEGLHDALLFGVTTELEMNGLHYCCADAGHKSTRELRCGEHA